jgi:hypothetical protein
VERFLTPAHPPRRYGNEDDYSSPIDDVDELLVFALALSAAQQRHPSVPASLPPHVQAQVRLSSGGEELTLIGPAFHSLSLSGVDRRRKSCCKRPPPNKLLEPLRPIKRGITQQKRLVGTTLPP